MKNKIWVYLSIVIGLVLILTNSCEKGRIPVLSTSDVSDISPTTASSGGIITDEGSAAVVRRGVCWSFRNNPTVDIHEGITHDGRGSGKFVSEITGLSPGITYYVRAYATNISGTAYGNEERFITTGCVLPTLTTNIIINITSSTATGGGNITDDGGGSVTVCGVVFSTIQNPTVETHDGITIEDERKGEFTSKLTGLKPRTMYHVRAYATNYLGTAYGNEVSFTTLEIETGTITDIEGNVYKTVKIVYQWWMAENLRTSTYTDDMPIPKTIDVSKRAGLYIGAYCWYDHDSATYENPYGKLYNWYAVNTGKLCPMGWHVPEAKEWSILIESLGGQNFVGDKLKEIGTTHWRDPNKWATNETGFSALPGGYRFYDGIFGDIRNSGYWWSATENDYTTARDFRIHHFSSRVSCYSATKRASFSVRCLKD